MKKSPFTILLSLLLINLSCTAQAEKKFPGTWEGALNVGAELRIIFHITEVKGGLQATADSPDQNAYGLKCDTAFASGQNLTIEMRSLGVTFSGALVNDSTIEGTFAQGGELPLVLHRKTAKSEAPPQQALTPSTYKSSDVSIKTKDVTLSGTLFQPLNKTISPVVLIIAGSGPTDRNGNNPILPGKNNSLLQLADSLAQHGIASLRYDKRGVGKSKMEPGLGEENTTINDMVNDAKAIYDWLKGAGYKDIYIAGHSEGSLIGMALAASVKPKGFISIAGVGRKAGEILKEQTTGQLPSHLKTEFDNAIDSLEKGLTVVKVDPSLMSLLRPSLQPYMKSWLVLDPRKLISQLSCPVLITQGTNDLQVKEIDAQSLHQSSKKSTLVIVKNMNHVLKEVAADKRSDNINAYSDPSLPVMGELIRSIASFVTQPSRP